MLYEFTDEEGIVHSYKLRTRPKPIIKKREFRQGDKAPDFIVNSTDVLWATAPIVGGRWLHSRELTRQPLIVAFFCTGWGAYKTPILEKLRSLHHIAQQTGAKLLVLTQTPSQELKAVAENLDIDFNISYDKNNRIAQSFGAYDALYPVWDRVGGINEDVVTPGIFVISAQGKFLYAKLDKDFEMEWDETSLKAALPTISSEIFLLKSA